MAERKEYPLATPDGEAIPLEIIRPLGLIRADFTDTATAEFAIPATAGYLVMRTDKDCLVQFDGEAGPVSQGSHNPGTIFVGAGEVLVIDHNGAATFSVIRWGTLDGTLIIQTCVAYADIRKRAQQERM